MLNKYRDRFLIVWVALIAESVRAGLRNARAKGTRLGRPRINLATSLVTQLRSQGRTIGEIAEAIGVSRNLVHKTPVNSRQSGAAIIEG